MKKITLIIIIVLNYQYITSQSSKNYFIKSININNEYSNFGTSIYGNDFIVYSSPKTATKDNKKMNSRIFKKQRQDMELFFGVNDGTGDIINGKVFNKEVNSTNDELDLVFTSDLKTVYFTRNISKKKSKEHLELFKANVLTPGFWINIQRLPFNNKSYSVGHPTLSKDNKTLFFASDMAGTLGGLDIFKVEILPNNKYGKPVNLGAKINTSETETTPFISNNTLYFSSNGRNGVGGLDVFSIVLDGKSAATNLEEPINSDKDDVAFIKIQSNDSGEFGYFTSNRQNTATYVNNTKRHIRNKSQKNNDIYYFKVLKEELDPEILIEKEDVVENNKESKPIIKKDITSFYENKNDTASKATKPIDDELRQRKIKLGLIAPDVPVKNNTTNTVVPESTIETKVITEVKEVAKPDVVVTEVVKPTIETNVVTEVKEAVKPDVVVTEVVKPTIETNVVTEVKEVVKPDVVVTEVVKPTIETNVVTEVKEVVKPDVVVTEVVKPTNKTIIDTEVKEEITSEVNKVNDIIANNKTAVENNDKVVNATNNNIPNNQTVNFRNLNSDNNDETAIKLASINSKNELANEFDICQTQLDKIKGIYFGLNKDHIRKDAAVQFNKVIDILKRCPNINVVITSHTDCRAPAKYNLELSQRRANSSVEYLIINGEFPRSRFKAVGYGEQILKNRCSDGVRCKESEHQINRRTEIEITNF